MAKQKEPASQPLLDLDTLAKRPFVRIDGKNYDIRNPGELDILTFHRIASRAEAVQRIMGPSGSEPEKLGDLSDESVRAVADALDQTCRVLFVDIPTDVYGRLSETQKLSVMTVFSKLQKASAPSLPAGTESGATETTTATGAK